MTNLDEYSREFNNNVKSQKICKNCRHFCPYVYDFGSDDDDTILSDFGECRRYPPKLVSPEDSGFPVVEETLWCGEFDI